MLDWFDGVAGPDYVRAIVWTLVALVLLVIVLVIVKLIRGMTFGTFVAGGRNRKTRLAVMDATAIDSHRRLVLVRRDDIEHLILIGGPTDVVVERDIHLAASRRAASTAGSVQQPAAPAPKPQASLGSPAAQPTVAQLPATHRTREPIKPTAPVPAPTRTIAAPRPSAYPISAPTYTRKPDPKPAPVEDDIDSRFADELEASLDDFSSDKLAGKAKPAAKASTTPDDEMNKLLGELASHKR